MSYSQFSEIDKGGKKQCHRSKNFTVMANYHLKDKRLSLKAKGLLSVMLSLPDDWNYNLKGLARLSMDGLDSVRSTVNELERYGFLRMNSFL